MKLGLLKLGYVPTTNLVGGGPGAFGAPELIVSIAGADAIELLKRLPMRVKQKPKFAPGTTKYGNRYRLKTKAGYQLVQITGKEQAGKSDVFDIETNGNFICNGIISHNTYNERIRSQLPVLINELKTRPTTRQGIITMYDACKDMGNWGGKDRVPCSLYYQFYIRKDKVNMVYAMRSCDFLTHFPFDVFLAVELLEHVAGEVGLEAGTFTHFLGSLHAYRKDMDTRGIF